jgi:hypothetical protein
VTVFALQSWMMSGVSVLESRLIEIHSSGPVSRRLPWLRLASPPGVCATDKVSFAG